MTHKLFFPLCFTSAVTLAACVAYEPVTPSPQAVVTTAPVVVAPAQPVVVQQPAVVVQTPALRAGYATVRNMQTLSDGSTRLTLTMNDNTTQYVDTRAQNLYVGAGVEITQEGYMRYPIAPQATRGSRY